MTVEVAEPKAFRPNRTFSGCLMALDLEMTLEQVTKADIQATNIELRGAVTSGLFRFKKEECMNRVWRLVIVIGITGLVLTLSMGPSWGQWPADNDKSDFLGNIGGGHLALRTIEMTPSLTAGGNTAYGEGALRDDTGDNNTAVGHAALATNDTGDANTAVGADALASNTSGRNNTAVGVFALSGPDISPSTGSANTAVGHSALGFNSTGNLNTAVGDSALKANDTGDNNTAVGVTALLFNTSGHENTAVGFRALWQNVDGDFNTAVGTRALENFCNLRGTCTFNTAVGFEALRNGETGFNNTALGTGTLFNSTGNNNTAVGENAGLNLMRGNNNIYLRAFGAATESDTMRLGRGQTKTFIAGIAGVSISGSTVMINGAGQLGVQMSSARYKRDIQAMGTRSQGLLQLRPVTFRYKDDVQGERHYGLIAEEVVKVYPELVTRGANEKVESVRYQELIPMLLNEQRQQQRKLVVQAQQLAELQAQNARLQVAIQQQQERDAALAARLERLEASAARAAALASR